LLACLLALLQGQSLSTEELQLHVMKRYNNLIMLRTLERHVLIEKKKKDRCDYGMVSHSLTHILTLAAFAIDQCFLTLDL